MAKIPDANTEAFYKGLNDRIYYPVVYTKENTLDREAQVNGYSTGVIFESDLCQMVIILKSVSIIKMRVLLSLFL